MEKCRKCQGEIKEVNVGFNTYIPALVCMNCKIEHMIEVMTSPKEEEKAFNREFEAGPVDNEFEITHVNDKAVTLPKGYSVDPNKLIPNYGKIVNILHNHDNQVHRITMRDKYGDDKVYTLHPGDALAFPYEYMKLVSEVPEKVTAIFYDEG